MKEKKNWFKGLVQRLYITGDAFLTNDLFTYAAAGAYSFFLSALPVMLMVLAILLRFSKSSPDMIRDIFGSITIFSTSFDIRAFFDSLVAIKSIGFFEVLIGISVFWMARRFFASIQQGLTVIYRKKGKYKPIKENLLVIAGEVLLVILIVLTAFAIIAGNLFFRTTLSENILSPWFFSRLKNIFRFVPLIITFVFLFFVYFIAPRTRPSAVQSLMAAGACTLSFTAFQFVFASLINLVKYNLVYGILSNMIVLVLEVYLFFMLFLFYAQLLYVVQFFENYLLAHLYLLPAYDDKNPFRQLERILFLEPTFYYRESTIRKKAGDVLFLIGENSNELYYILQGSVRLDMPNQVTEAVRGHIFGEFSCIIGGLRGDSATALTDVVLLKLPARLFQDTIEVYEKISRRTLVMIADYVRGKNKMPLSM